MFAKRISLFFACALLAGTATAATLARMDLSQLTRSATAVVQARCLGSASSWERGEIWTLTRFEPIETFKGHMPAPFTVRLIGGKVGAIESVVGGVPQFRRGEQVVLFLVPAPGGGYSIIAWSEGTFRVRKDSRGRAFVTQDTAAQLVYDPATRKFQVRGVHRMPLTSFRKLVEKLARQTRRTTPDDSRAPAGGGKR